jgi:hypothetical protein
VQLTGTPAGISATGGTAWVLTFSTPSVPPGPEVEVVLVTSRWPCPIHSEFWSCIFEGLYQLDLRIGRHYKQGTLVPPDSPLGE